MSELLLCHDQFKSTFRQSLRWEMLERNRTVSAVDAQ